VTHSKETPLGSFGQWAESEVEFTCEWSSPLDDEAPDNSSTHPAFTGRYSQHSWLVDGYLTVPAAVPEPTTWAMMVAGVLLLGRRLLHPRVTRDALESRVLFLPQPGGRSCPEWFS